MSHRQHVSGRPRHWLVHHMPVLLAALAMVLVFTMAAAVGMGARSRSTARPAS